MKKILIALFFPVAASAQIVSPTDTVQRMIKTANSTGASVDTIYTKITSSALLAAVHKQSLYSKGALNDGNFYYGVSAGLQWTTGIHNIAIGYETHRNNSTGSYNVMIGNGAGKAATGSGNMYIGPFQVGALQTSGSNNIMMRYNGNLSTTTVSNEMDIGAAIFGTGVNEVNGSNISAGKLGFFVRPLVGQVEHGGVSGLTSGMYYNTVIHPTINQSGTAGFVSSRITPYTQATGSGLKLLFDVGVNSAAFSTGTHTSYFNISSAGLVRMLNTPAGTSTDSILTMEDGIVKTVNASAFAAGVSWALSGNSTTAGTGTFLGTTSNTSLRLRTNNTERVTIDSTGLVGIGTLVPTARLHLPAGATGAGSAPLKLTSGNLNTTPESGAIEFNGGAYWATFSNGTRGRVQFVNVNVGSGGTATIGGGIYTDYIHSGTGSTWTLAAVAGNTSEKIYIKNRGSGNVVINTTGGLNEIYDASAVNTVTVTPGSSITLINDGTFWNVE